MKVGLDLVLVRDDGELGVVDVVVAVAAEHVAVLQVHPQPVIRAFGVISKKINLQLGPFLVLLENLPLICWPQQF